MLTKGSSFGRLYCMHLIYSETIAYTSNRLNTVFPNRAGTDVY